jgi:hypothetical protein
VAGSTRVPLPVPDSALARHAAPRADDLLLAAFRAARVPLSAWDHVAHVRVARLLLEESSFFSALAVMRAGIRRLNRENGVLETPDRGYHETITVAWMTLVADAMARDPGVSSLDFYIRHPELHDPLAILRSYSRELLRGREARARFVPPDLAPLPAVLETARADSCEARTR